MSRSSRASVPKTKKTKEPRLRLPIVGRRVVLRPPDVSDGPFLVRALGDREVSRGITLPSGYSLADAREFVRRSRDQRNEGTGYNLTVVKRGTGEPIGGCGLHTINFLHGTAHVGYWIVRSEWGHRYAPEAASLIIGAGFRELGLHRIHTGTLVGNRRSGRVLRRLGFRVEGRARHGYRVDGRYVDSILFGLVRPDFRPFRPGRYRDPQPRPRGRSPNS